MALGVGNLQRVRSAVDQRHGMPDWARAEGAARVLVRKVLNRVFATDWAS
jgi:hypothetical protein